MLDWDKLTILELEEMAEAGQYVLNCYRVLAKTSDNIVGELIKGHDTFYEMEHYPPGDVFDPETHSQYYYHAHRDGEHGHFHTFLRSDGMMAGEEPVSGQSHMSYMDERDDNICHLIAVSMDNRGFPLSLFTTNRWVTAENWYAAEDVVAFVDRFEIDVAQPSWPVNIWLTALIRLYKPVIRQLILERDQKIIEWQSTYPERDVFEDRDLEVTSEFKISVEEYLTEIENRLTEKLGKQLAG
ncbi:DUF6969 family protein [Sneathiella sp.]|jgi:hypothetical protein|uniref:DUF6969 family protein n=1 Tax=Sneathiella sp. TaxID=1964365 RepID=UPI0039E6305B